jgi:hypothetical protein
MAFLFPDQPVSIVQGRVNWILFLPGCAAGIVSGFLSARGAAASGSGYAATYFYMYVLFKALVFLVLAALPQL